MSALSRKISPALCCWSLFFIPADQQVPGESGGPVAPSAATRLSERGPSKGYADIVPFKDMIVAVGTDGRIDRIAQSGERIPIDHNNPCPLNCVVSNDEMLIAAGDKGTILYTLDGENFYRAESGTDKNIYGIASQNGLMLAGAENGTILASKNGKSWSLMQTEAKGNIVSLSANRSLFIGVTDAGEIIKSFNGTDWKVKDYNEAYAGYNQYSIFKKILATPSAVVIIGTHDDGSPSILFSSLGDVWAERFPIYHDDQGMICSLTSAPNGIAYDSGTDQFVLACDHGEMISLPACAKCNEHIKISENDLNAIACLGSHLVIVGDDFSVFVQRL
jgi:hypothetical protein